MNPAPHAYDALNRIANIVEAADNRQFGYSATGNMWVTTTSTAWAPTSFTPRSAEWFDAATNRLVSPSLQITHDNAGHLTKIGTHNYAYDAENRLKTSTINSVTTTFEYDGEGRRVKKGNETYVYDAFGNLAAEYGGTVSTPGTQYVTADHLGSTRLTTGETGAPAGRLDYFPFGETIPGGASFGNRPSPPTGPRQKFTGKERDTETNLDYFIARYYSAPQGRFTSPDAPFADQIPADPQSWNLYTYVGNNPLRHVDESGRCFRPGGNCVQYLAGVAKAVGNIPSGIINFPNRSLDGVLGLFNGGQRVFGDLVPDTFTATNADQREGMEAANVALLVSPLAQVGAAAAIEAIGVGRAGVSLRQALREIANSAIPSASLENFPRRPALLS